MTKESPDPRLELYARLQAQVDDEAVDRADAGYLSAVFEVVTLWRRWRSDRRVAVPGEVEVKFRVVYPLAMHALNNVDAALALSARPWVAAVNARVAFEYALAAQWVLLTHGGEQEIVGWMNGELHKRTSGFLAGLGEPAEYAGLAGEKPPQSDWTVYDACARFGDPVTTKLFYDMYRNLTTAVHPSIAVLSGYASYKREGGIRALSHVGGFSECDATAQALCAASLWALDAVEQLRRAQPNLAELHAVGNRAGLPSSLRASDQHPERQHPPTAPQPDGQRGH